MNPEDKKKNEDAPVSPMDFLSKVPGAPTKNDVEAWKMQAPAGRIKLFTPDGTAKRVFILRALSGLEMESISKAIPAGSTNPDLEMQIGSCVKAVVWTNTTQDGQVDDMYFRKNPAGLAVSMFSLISKISDFIDPETLETFSADL